MEVTYKLYFTHVWERNRLAEYTHSISAYRNFAKVITLQNFRSIAQFMDFRKVSQQGVQIGVLNRKALWPQTRRQALMRCQMISKTCWRQRHTIAKRLWSCWWRRHNVKRQWLRYIVKYDIWQAPSTRIKRRPEAYTVLPSWLGMVTICNQMRLPRTHSFAASKYFSVLEARRLVIFVMQPALLQMQTNIPDGVWPPSPTSRWSGVCYQLTKVYCFFNSVVTFMDGTYSEQYCGHTHTRCTWLYTIYIDEEMNVELDIYFLVASGMIALCRHAIHALKASICERGHCLRWVACVNCEPHLREPLNKNCLVPPPVDQTDWIS